MTAQKAGALRDDAEKWSSIGWKEAQRQVRRLQVRIAKTNGFTFLGQTFRKYGRKLHITPSAEGVLALVRKVGTLIKKHVSAPMPALIKKLNEVLRGWAYYHRHVVSSDAFSRIDTYVFEQLKRMLRNRHPNKSKKWLYNKYWTAAEGKHTFAVIAKIKKGVKKVYQVVRTCSIV